LKGSAGSGAPLLLERPNQEIVDDILTAIVGGVVNEPVVFDVKSVLYPLAQPAQDVRSITGTIQPAGQPGEAHHHNNSRSRDFVSQSTGIVRRLGAAEDLNSQAARRNSEVVRRECGTSLLSSRLQALLHNSAAIFFTDMAQL
jgi:hypothetical protein